jgi:hypothetical protein
VPTVKLPEPNPGVTVNVVFAVAVVELDLSVTGPTRKGPPGALGRVNGGAIFAARTLANAVPVILEPELNGTVVLGSVLVSPLFAVTVIGVAQTFTTGQNNKQMPRSA